MGKVDGSYKAIEEVTLFGFYSGLIVPKGQVLSVEQTESKGIYSKITLGAGPAASIDMFLDSFPFDSFEYI